MALSKHHQTLLLLATAGTAAGLFNWWRGKEGKEWLVETVTLGSVSSAGLLTIAFLHRQTKPYVPSQGPGLLGTTFALANGLKSASEVGQKAMQLLGEIDADTLYAPLKKKGLKVGPVPADPSIV